MKISVVLPTYNGEKYIRESIDSIIKQSYENKETRNNQDIRVLERSQRGIMDYFGDYMSILPESARDENKKLDEKLLALINRVQILDEQFLELKVDDLFFGRITNIKDVIG